MSAISRYAWFLVPGIVQGAVAFLTIPVATLRLGPADYGAFALVTGLTAAGSSLGMLGSGYRLAEVFSRGDQEEIRRAVTAQLVTSSLLLLACMSILVLAWWWGREHWESLAAVPFAGVVLSAAAMLGTGWWLVTSEVLTLTRRARMFAFGMMLQPLLNALILIVTLFVFDLGALSLYAAAFGASAAALISSAVALRPYLTTRISGQHLRQVYSGAGLMTVSNASEAAYQAVERSLLSNWASLSQLGLYVHAQQYRALVSVAVKAGARSVWRDSLDEARRGDGVFGQTGAVWSLCYLAIGAGALVLAAVGPELIGALTHGKFVEAAPYAAASVAILLAIHLGKPQTAMLYAFGHGYAYARSTVIALAVAGVIAVLTIPVLGVWGALLAGLAQNVLLRLQIYFLAKRLGATPRQDRVAWWGMGLLMLQLGFDSTDMSASFAVRTAVVTMLSATLFWIARKDVAVLWTALRAKLEPGALL